MNDDCLDKKKKKSTPKQQIQDLRDKNFEDFGISFEDWKNIDIVGYKKYREKVEKSKILEMQIKLLKEIRDELKIKNGQLNAEYLTIKEAADFCKISTRTLRRDIAKYKIPHYKIHSKILFKIDDIRKILTQHRIESLDNEGFFR